MKPLDPRLMRYARDARGYMVFLVATGFLMTVATIVQCLALSHAVSPLVGRSGTLRDVAVPIAIMVAAFGARALLQFGQEARGHRAALRTITDIRAQVIASAGDRGGRWLADGHAAPTVSLVSEGLDDVEPYFVKFLPQLVLTTLATPAALAVIMWLDWLSAVAIIICIPLIPIFMILIGKMTAQFSSERLRTIQRLSDELLDLLSGLSTLKALGRESSPKRQVRELGDSYAAATMQTLYLAFMSGAVLEFLATLSTALVAVEVGLRMVGGHIPLVTGLAIIMLTPEALKPLREVGAQFHASADGVAAAAAAFDLIEAPAEVHNGTVAAPDLRTATIEVKGLSVRAPGRDVLAPAHLSATIDPGKITVLRGASGGGKSTTASVLMGFVAPTHGTVTVGGIDLATIDRESLWQQISWVPQRPVIVPGTVAENMGTAITARVLEAAELTGFAEVVASLPEGWTTRVGQGGVGLSVGQRQRLALTRALVERRPLIVLDEPSAHLDAVSETYVNAAVDHLAAAGHTILVIAHRPALVARADAVIDVRSEVLA